MKAARASIQLAVAGLCSFSRVVTDGVSAISSRTKMIQNLNKWQHVTFGLDFNQSAEGDLSF